MATLLRITTDFKQLEENPPSWCSAGPVGDESWSVYISGPPDTVYAGGLFELSIGLPVFPFHPPVIKFVTQIYHCNINRQGRILNLYGGRWMQGRTLCELLTQIRSLLEFPRPRDALVPSIAREMETNPAQFVDTALSWTHKFASGSNDVERATMQEYTELIVRLTLERDSTCAGIFGTLGVVLGPLVLGYVWDEFTEDFLSRFPQKFQTYLRFREDMQKKRKLEARPPRPPPRTGDAVIFVKYLTGQVLECTFDCHDIIYDLKRQVTTQKGGDPADLIITWVGKVLEDERTLASYHLCANVTISLSMRTESFF